MNEVAKLVTSIGAIAEVLGVYRKGLLKAGFSRKESLMMTKDFQNIVWNFCMTKGE